MEVFIKHISSSADWKQLHVEIAKVLHGPTFEQYNKEQPLNFNVYIFPRKRGLGCLTLPSEEVGSFFLEYCGGQSPRIPITLGYRHVSFQLSSNQVQQRIVDKILRTPYIDPYELEGREMKSKGATNRRVSIQTLQFGRRCRDDVFSVEWERRCQDNCYLEVDEERKAMTIKITEKFEKPTQIIIISFSQIIYKAASQASDTRAIFFSLRFPPMFELEAPETVFIGGMELDLSSLLGNQPHSRGVSLADPGHRRIAPYTSLSLRLVCATRKDLRSLHNLCKMAHLPKPVEYDHPIERRGLFSARVMDDFSNWLVSLEWRVAYQAEALVRNYALDPVELLSLRHIIQRVILGKGTEYVADFLRYFGLEASRDSHNEKNQSLKEHVEKLFLRSLRKFTPRYMRSVNEDLFDCHRVLVTPTSIFMEGPFPEISNRVIRTYTGHEDCFIRVAFVEENRLDYQLDRQVNWPKFLKEHVGGILLRDGLTVGGKHFSYLQYSLSSLKEHAAWFVTPFVDRRTNQKIDAATIIKSLGSFTNLTFDKRLIYCPARYGARLSQAFTTTQASVVVEAEDIRTIPDIERNDYCFTDGVGTLSPQLAKDIWQQLSQRRGFSRSRVTPRAFQIRFGGSKGMLSVDYELSGRTICLRPSMIKFESPHSQVEIAGVFDKPAKMLLNRPFIMLLEGLGVPTSVFLDLQNRAVHDIQTAKTSLSRMATLLESHGLGSSFHLTSVLLNLEKLNSHMDDAFYHRMMDVAVNHILRDLKHHARIPVPGQSWNLVGVADVHSYLQAGQIFACIQQPESAPIYMEGWVLISRSPVIHPGDVQRVWAIGKPPDGSPFARESLHNTVVFSIQGERPLPSCLGGGDLDGDTYHLTDYKLLHPPRIEKSAAYKSAPRQELGRPSTIKDVAEFFQNYILSNIIGLISINWLITADQSPDGIFDRNCIVLAGLHSLAVDYQKTGRPVPFNQLPRTRHNKPDWRAPETETSDGSRYKRSERAIGQLYRAIQLQPIRRLKRDIYVDDDQMPDDHETLRQALRKLAVSQAGSNHDPLYSAVQSRVSVFIDAKIIDAAQISLMRGIFRDYAWNLESICMTHTLSRSPSARLAEEEAIVGSIAAACSRPKKRQDMMSSLREHTAQLVLDVRDELVADESDFEKLRRAWMAWNLALMLGEDVWGAKSFWWIALSAIFETIKAIEEQEFRVPH